MMLPLQIPSDAWQTIKVVACIFHGSAIATTSFRLGYRLCTSKFWWEDAWAAIALVFDIICLFGVWGEAPTFDDDPRVYTVMFWLIPIAFTSVLWAARMSTIYPVLRVADPRGALRWTVYAIISCFAVMWTALVIQKVLTCVYHGCNIGSDVAIADLVTDAVSDLMLVITPMYLLRDVGLTHHQRILVTSVFCASLLTTAISIPLSILLLLAPTSQAALIFGHVKPATSLVIANLLVIVSFVYRYMRNSRADLDQPAATRAAEFSTFVDLDQFTMDRNWSIAQTSSVATCTVVSTQV
ncbi:hypothetical protein EV702DRAFT_635154 [Suillus placidus]|uniref:Rhodopsin domain-containing protein n=1 Tax=Suillus placidus TaxID=48579 RepID=A0A9P7CZK9_9AGAM|nr:hypothetical protein EV702DRAFT_635154 [Suillus placidus]